MAHVHDSNHPEGVYDDRDPEGVDDDLARARERKGTAAMNLYSKVFSWSRVAEMVGYPSARAARIAAERAMEVEFREDPRQQEFARKYLAKTIDNLMASIANKTLDPNHPEQLQAIRTARDLIATKAKLLGLDAPTKISLVDPTAREIEEYLDSMIGPRDIPDDANVLDDVIEGEIVEDAG